MKTFVLGALIFIVFGLLAVSVTANECDNHSGWYEIFGPYCQNPVDDWDIPGLLPRDTWATFDAYGGGTYTAPIASYYWDVKEQRWWYIAFEQTEQHPHHSWMFPPEAIHSEGN